MPNPSRSRRRLPALLAMLLLPSAGARAATYTVSKDGRGAFTTIQAAVDKAGRNDVVEILDAAVYAEQVTIDSGKTGLSLRSSHPAAASKPVLRFQDTRNRDPRTCQEALDPARITYDRNGALRLLEVEGVTLAGLEVDGGGAAPFSWPSVWGNGVDCTGQLYPLFHGNAALVLHRSARVTVRDCVFRNAFFGVDVNDRNAAGAFAIPFLVSAPPPSPRLGFAGTGGHLFENCLFAGNVLGVAGQVLQGLPSTFRNNRFHANGHPTQAAARTVKLMPEGEHYPGGAVFLRGDPFCPWFFEHNTFLGNYLIFNGHYQPNGNHLVQGNLFGPPSRYWGADSVFPNPFHELLPMLWNGLRRNLVAAQAQPPESGLCAIRFSAVDSATGDTVRADSSVACGPVRLMNGFPVPELRPDTLRMDLAVGGRRLPATAVIERSPPFAPLLDAQAGVEPSRRQGNRWWEPRFVSVDPAAVDFLAPAWPSPAPAEARPEGFDYGDLRDAAALPGRIPPAEQAPTLLRVTPLEPAREAGGDLELAFEVEARGPVVGLAVAGAVPVEAAPLNPIGFGGSSRPAVAFHAGALPSAALRIGFNRIRIPRPWARGKLGMVHLLLRGQASGGVAFSEWTSIPAGYWRQDFRVAVDGDTGAGPIEAPADGRLLVALSGLPDGPAPPRIRLQRLSGLPLEYLDPGRADSGWLASPAEPVAVRLPGDPGRLRYDAVLAYSLPVPPDRPPAVSGMSPLLRFPGAAVSVRPRAESRPARIPPARDALGRRVGPRRKGFPAVSAFPPAGP